MLTKGQPVRIKGSTTEGVIDSRRFTPDGDDIEYQVRFENEEGEQERWLTGDKLEAVETGEPK
jgi:hypothetical protein